MHEKIDSTLQSFLDKYFNIEINIETKKKFRIKTPYFRRSSGFLTPALYSGKADPWSIEKEINAQLSENKGHIKSKEDIVSFMHDINLGIDCSGLVYQVLNFFFLKISDKSKPLSSFLPNEKILNIRKYYSRKFRPECSVSANMFTSQPISKNISVEKIKPLDLIRTQGGGHILLVTETKRNSSNEILWIKFVQSSYWHKRDGVRYGEIIIADPKSPNLLESKWIDCEEDKKEKNYTYRGYRNKHNQNGIFRLNFIE